jgi:hypothetical protein
LAGRSAPELYELGLDIAEIDGNSLAFEKGAGERL